MTDDYDGLSPSFAPLCGEADAKVDQHKLNERAREFHKDIPLIAKTGIASVGALQRIYERELAQQRARYGAAESTVEALMYSLRTHGADALAGNQHHLLALSSKQIEDVIVRLHKLRAKHPAINDQLLDLLVELVP